MQPLASQPGEITIFERGHKFFELSKHPGNVLSTQVGNNSDGETDTYAADILSATDYYPFGMAMPGRHYDAGAGYRYGFNGKEKDKDLNSLTAYDYGFRIYNPGMGKFLSVDPIAEDYPSLTPYQFASNQPIESVDLDGLERDDYRLIKNDGKSSLQHISTGPLTEHLQGPTIFGWEVYGDNISIPYYTRVEYNGQHYIFASGGSKSKAAYIPMASAYTIQYDNNIHYVAEFEMFTSNPDKWITSHQSEEQGKEILDGKLQWAQWMHDAMDAYHSSVDNESSTPSTPHVQSSSAAAKPAAQQKIAVTPRLHLKQISIVNKGFSTIDELRIKEGMKISSSQALELGEKFLGKGYTEPVKGSGRYVSEDGKRVFRMGVNDITGKHAGGAHVNFETLEPNKTKSGKMKLAKMYMSI
jgi:RHS repeat-associated protein